MVRIGSARATSGDLDLATHGDFLMATDRGPDLVHVRGALRSRSRTASISLRISALERTRTPTQYANQHQLCFPPPIIGARGQPPQGRLRRHPRAARPNGPVPDPASRSPRILAATGKQQTPVTHARRPNQNPVKTAIDTAPPVQG